MFLIKPSETLTDTINNEVVFCLSDKNVHDLAKLELIFT